GDVGALIALFEDAHTFGSLIMVPATLIERLPLIEQRAKEVARHAADLFSQTATHFLPVLEQAKLLSHTYDCVAANPPYMGSKYFASPLKEFVNETYKEAKADLYACFIH